MKISPLPPPSPHDTIIELRIKTRVVDISSRSGGIILITTLAKKVLYKIDVTLNTQQKLEVLKTREKVYQLYLEGKSQVQISQEAHISQPTVHRHLRAMQKEALDYLNNLARGRIVEEYKEVLDSLSYIKRRCYMIIDKIGSSDDLDEGTKAKLIFVGLKVAIQSDSEKYRILTDSPSILAIETMSARLDEIERQYKKAYR